MWIKVNLTFIINDNTNLLVPLKTWWPTTTNTKIRESQAQIKPSTGRRVSVARDVCGVVTFRNCFVVSRSANRSQVMKYLFIGSIHFIRIYRDTLFNIKSAIRWENKVFNHKQSMICFGDRNFNTNEALIDLSLLLTSIVLSYIHQHVVLYTNKSANKRRIKTDKVIRYEYISNKE